MLMKRSIVYAMIMMVMMTAQVISQPPGTQQGTSAFSGRTAKIALLWGDQFQPAAVGIKAVSNLQQYAKTNGLPIGSFDKVWIAKGDLSEYLVLFMIADSQVQITAAEKEKIRNYLKSGGFLVLDDAAFDQDRSPSAAALSQIANDLADPGNLENIPNDHAIYSIMYDFGGPPFLSTESPSRGQNEKPRWLRGLMINGRLAMVLSDRGYSTAWSKFPQHNVSNDFGLNLISFALVSRKR